MNNFTFYSPTQFVFGKETEQQVGDLCKQYGAHKVLIVYGGGSAVKSGLIDRVKSSLTEAGLAFIEMSGVQPNPTEGKVYEGLTLVKNEGVDFMLAVGGGSVIDTAKAIAVAKDYDGDFWDLYIGKAQAATALPVGVVLTIPAAGSEGSGNTVITNTKTGQKFGLRLPMLLRPKFAVMNPELTLTLPAWQTASGICDMIVHILERYFSNTPNVELTDRLCEGAIKAIINEGRKVMKDPQDYDARANIMWAGTIAHNDTCGVGREEDWSSHQMEHEISAMFDVTHGAGLAVVTPAYMTFMSEHNCARMRQFAERVFDIRKEDVNPTALYMKGEDTAIALEGIRRFREFLHDDLKLPVTMGELLPQVKEKDMDKVIEQLATRLHQNKGEEFGAFYPLKVKRTIMIYQLAR